MIRFRNAGDPEPQEPYIEIAPPEADPYLPRFSVFKQVEIAPNLMLNLPAPEEIAASKMAFADRIVAGLGECAALRRFLCCGLRNRYAPTAVGPLHGIVLRWALRKAMSLRPVWKFGLAVPFTHPLTDCFETPRA